MGWHIMKNTKGIITDFCIALIVCIAIVLSVLLCLYFQRVEFGEFPPRAEFPRVYETVHVDVRICWKCHSRP